MCPVRDSGITLCFKRELAGAKDPNFKGKEFGVIGLYSRSSYSDNSVIPRGASRVLRGGLRCCQVDVGVYAGKPVIGWQLGVANPSMRTFTRGSKPDTKKGRAGASIIGPVIGTQPDVPLSGCHAP